MKLSRYAAGRRAYCVDRYGLRGVVEHPPLAPAPRAPNWIVGAYNHLGRAVAVVDVGALLGLAPPTRAPGCLLLVDSVGHLLALVADAPPEDHAYEPFRRRGGIVEVVDPQEDLLWIDLAQLHDAIQTAMLGPTGV